MTGNNAQRRRMNKHRQTGLRPNTPNPLGPRAWRRKEERRVRLETKAAMRRGLLAEKKRKARARLAA